MIRLGIVFYIFVFASAKQLENDLNSGVCHSSECFQIAHDIWQSMNHSANPCDNFYEYACGNFASSNPVPKSELTWGTLQKMRRNVKLRMLAIVTEKYNSSDILPVKQVKKFYSSCTSYFQIAQRGLKHIKAYLAQIGGWPLIMERDEWSPYKTSWQDINKFYSRMLFLPSFYRVKVTIHFKNLSDFTLDVDNPFKVITILPPVVPLEAMALYSGKFFNKNITDMYNDGSYANYTVTMADILAKSRSANISREQLLQDVENMISLEKKFQNISDNFDTEPNYVKIDELQDIYDKNAKTPETRINWKELMTEFFNEAKVELDGEELFKIASDDHFKKLAEILENTSHRTLVNYMHWQFVTYLLPYTSLYFQTLRTNLFNNKEGIMEKPRWENCITNLAMPQALAYQYVKKFFSNNDKDKVELIYIAIQKEMVKHIKEADWLNDETKKDELAKIENMKINIGFPQWLTNETLLTAMYQGLVIGNQYMENIISIKRFNMKKDLQYLKSTAKIKEWYAHPIYVNAYFFNHKNILNIPAAVIQHPVFSILQPNTVNYGEIGFIIGHEVSHGFDATGIEFNKDGRKYIWPEDTRQAIKQKTECFANQYEKFKNNSENKIIKEKVAKGILDENLSDSLGISLIYSALEEMEKTNKSLKLPGFENWNNRKIFFLSFARLHCYDATPGYEETMGKYFTHSPQKYRVNSPLQNFEEFSKVFNCPVDSPMNPSLKCKLW